MDNRLDAHSPIIERARLALPDGTRVAFWIGLNIEHYQVHKPATSIFGGTAGLQCDPLNHGWRDHGPRVGIWRLVDLLDKCHMRASVLLTADVSEAYPQIIREGNKRGWVWLAHGKYNSIFEAGMSMEEERAYLRDVVGTIERETGQRPKGWPGPALIETSDTPEILVELGLSYVLDWRSDDQPFPLEVKAGRMISVPYSIELNDVSLFLGKSLSGQDFAQTIMDEFDLLYQQGQHSARVMCLALHSSSSTSHSESTERSSISPDMPPSGWPAPLFIDIIRAFTDVRSPLASNLDSLIAAIRNLLAVARERETPVIFGTVACDVDLQKAGMWIRKIPPTAGSSKAPSGWNWTSGSSASRTRCCRSKSTPLAFRNRPGRAAGLAPAWRPGDDRAAPPAAVFAHRSRRVLARTPHDCGPGRSSASAPNCRPLPTSSISTQNTATWWSSLKPSATWTSYRSESRCRRERGMLKGIDPLLSPELLHVLAQMGHGDEIVLVDRNFPAVATARRLVRLDGCDLPTAVRAVLSLLPLDTFVQQPIAAMAVVDDPGTVPAVQQDVFALARSIESRELGVERVERFAFYERARQAFAVVATSEARAYGCVILTKGVIF